MMTENHSFPVMEHFYTIQGEGRFTGYPAYFIRLGGCDLGCVWCDVKESWEAGKWPVHSIEEIVSEAERFPGRLVVITGGEPLMYDLGPLTSLLKEKGKLQSRKLPDTGHVDILSGHNIEDTGLAIIGRFQMSTCLLGFLHWQTIGKPALAKLLLGQ